MFFYEKYKPQIEGIKEVLRWALLFVISWIITVVLAQINAVPETHRLALWVFVFDIPVRAILLFTLTFIGRYIDKVRFERSKEKMLRLDEKPSGLLPF